MTMRRIGPFIAAASVVLLAACQDDTSSPQPATSPQFDASSSMAAAEIEALMDNLNVALAAQGADYRVAMAEYITVDGSDEAGATILQKDVGNKQFGTDFVPNDPRRADWSGPFAGADNITYAIDRTIDATPPLGGLTGAQTDAAIVRATGTWDGVTCSDLGLVRNNDFGLDIGVIAYLVLGTGGPSVLADVQHAGWGDIDFAPGILGVTFTFIFLAGPNPTDIDGNGKLDVAFREIYYDPSFSWADDGVNDIDIDVESIALHEAGHGLSQAHFGNIFIKKSGFTASPRAVMNAFYQAPFRALQGTDNGGHCSNWAAWPNQ